MIDWWYTDLLLLLYKFPALVWGVQYRVYSGNAPWHAWPGIYLSIHRLSILRSPRISIHPSPDDVCIGLSARYKANGPSSFVISPPDTTRPLHDRGVTTRTNETRPKSKMLRSTEQSCEKKEGPLVHALPGEPGRNMYNYPPDPYFIVIFSQL